MSEVLWSLVSWFAFTAAANFFYIISCDDDIPWMEPYLCRLLSVLALLLRNSLNLLILTLYAYCNKTDVTECMEKIDPEALIKVEDALVNEDALTYFIAFLRESGQNEGIQYINAYSLIKEFEEYAKAECENVAEITQKAEAVLRQLKNEELVQRLDEGFLLEKIYQDICRGENIDSHIFDQVFGVVINALQRMYGGFKESQFYLLLVQKQESISIIIERMKSAMLI